MATFSLLKEKEDKNIILRHFLPKYLLFFAFGCIIWVDCRRAKAQIKTCKQIERVRPMEKTVATTNKMTDGQPARIADRLVPYFRKEGANLPKGAVQTVLNKEMEALLKEMFEAFRGRVDTKLALAPRGTFTVSLSQKHNPDSYYRDRPGLCERPGLSIWRNFCERIATKAKSTETGTTFAVTSFDTMRSLNDEEIEGGLSDNHFFDETQVCAIIAELITSRSTRLVTNPHDNRFYTGSCVVGVSWACTSDLWHVGAWERDPVGV